MDLSSELISQFVRVTKTDLPVKKESLAYGTIVVYNDQKYVRLDGSELLTPVTFATSTKENDRVAVTIKNHSAVVTGNLTSPSTSQYDFDNLSDEIGDKITEFEVAIGDMVDVTLLNAVKADVQLLQADNVTIKDQLNAANADIKELDADNVLIREELTAKSADIEKLQADDVTIKGDLEAANADIESLQADNVTINEKLTAREAEIGKLEVDMAEFEEATVGRLEVTEADLENLEAKYTNIDFANIKDLITGDAIFTKGEAEELYITRLAVTEANILTLTVGQLVVKGNDGRYYQLVVDAESEDGFSLREVEMDGDQLTDNTVSGGKIIENSITARELNVETIFADEAIIREILAGYGRFGDLEVINGFIAKLETQLIESKGLKILVKDDIDALRTEFNQQTDSFELRVEAAENGLSNLQTGVTVDNEGVTIRQPNQTDNTLVLKGGSVTINAPGREALVISQAESYMPNLRVTQFVMGNLVTTVSGEGADCRVVSQYVST